MAENGVYLWSGTFDELNEGDQRSVAQLIEDGGAVSGSTETITRRLERTLMLTLLRVCTNGQIVGVAALKTPEPKYRADKFAKAGVPISNYATASEFGYVVVAREMRGRRLSGKLVGAIVKKLREPTFATTDDNAMRSNLKKAGFVQAGREWMGQRGKLSLWIIDPR